MGTKRNVEIEAEKLRDKIKICGYQQKELAEKLGVSHSYISASLKNETMNGRTLRQIAAFLNCDADYFVKKRTEIKAEAPARVFSSDSIERTNNLLTALYKRICSLEKEVQTLSNKFDNVTFMEPTDEQMFKYIVDRLERGKSA